jgi:8-oxo-dGTP diphosphatase
MISQLATLIYVQFQGKTLMLHRNKKENDVHTGKWNGLGGKLEAGESPHACMLRELEEESWLRATQWELKWLLTAPAFTPGKDWYIYIFMVSKFEGELIECPEGTLEWIDSDKLLSLNLREGDRQFLPLLFEPWFVHITAIYNEWKHISTDIIRQI